MAKGLLDIILDQFLGATKPKKKRKKDQHRRQGLTVMQMEQRDLVDLWQEERQRRGDPWRRG